MQSYKCHAHCLEVHWPKAVELFNIRRSTFHIISCEYGRLVDRVMFTRYPNTLTLGMGLTLGLTLISALFMPKRDGPYNGYGMNFSPRHFDGNHLLLNGISGQEESKLYLTVWAVYTHIQMVGWLHRQLALICCPTILA